MAELLEKKPAMSMQMHIAMYNIQVSALQALAEFLSRSTVFSVSPLMWKENMGWQALASKQYQNGPFSNTAAPKARIRLKGNMATCTT